MDDETSVQLSKLKRYLPFLNFILELDSEKHAKFIDIRKWISTSTRFSKEILDKFESAILRRYNVIINETDVQFPQEIKNLFPKVAPIVTVDLLSDDGDSDCDSDDDVIIVSESEFDENSNIEERLKRTHKKSVPETRIDNVATTVEEEKPLFKRREDFKNENASCSKQGEKRHEPPTVTICLDSESEDESFLRESPIIFTAVRDSQQAHNLKESETRIAAEISRSAITIINYDHGERNLLDSAGAAHASEDSSDSKSATNDAGLAAINLIDPIDNLENVLNTNSEVLSNTSKEIGSEDLDERLKETTKPKDTQLNTPLEDLPIEKLEEIYIRLLKKQGLYIPELLMVGQTDEAIVSDQPSINGIQNIPPSSLASSAEPPTGIATAVVPNERPFNHNSIPVVSTDFRSYPKQFKLNLKDPRVVKKLMMSQTANQTSILQTANSQGPNVPLQAHRITYGEYKRRREEEMKRKSEANKELPSVAGRGQHENKAKDKEKQTDESPQEGKENANGDNKYNKDVETAESSGKSGDPDHKDDTSFAAYKSKLLDILSPYQKEIEMQLKSVLEKKETKIDAAKEKPEAKSDPNAKTKLSRTLKELECTVKGYDDLKDYIPKSGTGKRRCSINARKCISLILADNRKDFVANGYNSSDDDDDDASELESSTKRYKSSAAKNVTADRRKRNSDKRTESKRLESNSHERNTKRRSEQNEDEGKSSAKTKNALVLCHRLSDTEIAKFTETSKRKMSRRKSQVASKSDVSKKRSRKSSSPLPHTHTVAPKVDKRNIDSYMTERSTKQCVICKTKPKNLTSHYILTHQTESYVSRLSFEELDDLQKHVPFVEPAPGNAGDRTPKYSIECIFCSQKIVDTFVNFHEHYSKHTGELAFQCSACNYQSHCLRNVKIHTSIKKKCNKARQMVLYQYPQNLMVIYLHCCKICNFVQLNAANVLKHLRDHHNKRCDDPTYVEKYILAAINDGECLPEPDDSSPMDDDRVLVANEPIVDDDIKDEPEFFGFGDDRIARSPLNLLVEMPTADDVKPIKEDIDFQPQPDTTARKCYKIYKADTPYFGLFKCMSEDCYFSTDIEDLMYEHLSECDEESVISHDRQLACPYCYWSISASIDPDHDSNFLIEHIRERHQCSRFQCSRCCYRSCLPGNVEVHQNYSHRSISGDLFIYECAGPSIENDEKINDLHMAMEQNVRPMNCSYCPLEFYAVNSIQEHLLIVHQTDPGSFDRFVCLYCYKTAKHKGDIIVHLALNHPDELAYACERLSSQSDSENVHVDSIKNLSLCNVEVDIVPGTIKAARFVEETVKLASKVLAAETLSTDVISQPSGSNDCNAPEEIEEKPSYDKLIDINTDVVIRLLHKLTFKTGVAPDRLYHCPEGNCGGIFSIYSLWHRHMRNRHICLVAECPHCTAGNDASSLPLDDFELHFEAHRMHLYVCYYCGQTANNESNLRQHIGTSHVSDDENPRMEKVATRNYSYFVGIRESSFRDRLSFLQGLRDVISERLKYLEEIDAQQIVSQWKVASRSPEWLEIYPAYVADHDKRTIKCWFENCSIFSSQFSSIFDHITANHPPPTELTRLSCKMHEKCTYKARGKNSLSKLHEHSEMHTKAVIHVCGLCQYHHYERKTISTHIRSEHNLRDVPVVTVGRDNDQIEVAVHFVFAVHRRTFTTMSGKCFCCEKTFEKADAFVNHIKKDHNLILRYFCELCGAKLSGLRESEEHFNNEHPEQPLKISCQLNSRSLVSVRSIYPFKLQIDADTKDGHERAITIKQEIPYDDNDVLIMEDDDIVIDGEMKIRERESSENVSRKVGEIKCVAVGNLLETKKAEPMSVAPINLILSNPTTITTTQSINQPSHQLPNPKILKVIKLPNNVNIFKNNANTVVQPSPGIIAPSTNTAAASNVNAVTGSNFGNNVAHQRVFASVVQPSPGIITTNTNTAAASNVNAVIGSNFGNNVPHQRVFTSGVQPRPLSTHSVFTQQHQVPTCTGIIATSTNTAAASNVNAVTGSNFGNNVPHQRVFTSGVQPRPLSTHSVFTQQKQVPTCPVQRYPLPPRHP